MHLLIKYRLGLMVDMTTDDGSKCLAGTVSDADQQRDDESLQAGTRTLAITLF